ncbi:hypothetical protein QBC33DRAFT_574672 [Phialemonium atrogriseum]|uniref:Cytochrome b5 heme-binding domain-containing protein n=1 Tax=Phialemonium atrogriseum TaxID=1093897 RepID=A0AAJ0BTP7_9PEZI|nr:uncharacterized protein QBC33DRAFT_574672 [Phialemonium atrogriseum]KAK1761856.1 hypothetical protein QBC33DRAFT_574672 [Phialemonium atrogriseum]
MRQEYEWSQIEKHSRPDDLYLVINGKVYDVTTFQHAHPDGFMLRQARGGEDFLLDQGGKDVTELFNDAGHSDEARAILTTLQIGVVKAEENHVQQTWPTSGSVSPQSATFSGAAEQFSETTLTPTGEQPPTSGASGASGVSGVSEVLMPDAGPDVPDGFALQSVDFALESFQDDFTSFMDSVPLPNHIFSPTHQPLPAFFPDLGLPWAVSYPEADPGWPSELRMQAPNTAEESASALSTYGSRLPSLQPENTPPDPQNSSRGAGRGTQDHLVVSAQDRDRLIHELSCFSSCVPDGFVLPSKHALSRFVAAYFNAFHEHYPFLHVPTLRMGSISVELFIAVAAVGARYSREPEVGVELFHLAKAIVLERIRRRRAASSTDTNAEIAVVGEDGVGNWSKGRCATVEILQTLLLLIAIATWFKRQPGVYEALSIRSVLDSLVREDDLERGREPRPDSWRDWIKYESLKRIKLVVFCFFNIHSIVFDILAMMLSSELHLDLPSSENEWKAANEMLWRESCDVSSPPQDFQAASEQLFAPADTPSRPNASSGFSSLGGYTLIHAVIQRIWLVRNAGLTCQRGQQLSPEMMKSFEQALKAWSSSWECNRESSMDPLSPHGPLSFTSTALLRMAYIRINMDLGPIRSLGTWDPGLIAKSLDGSPPAQRSYRLTRAALHCAHALSIPVKLGINFVAQTQVVYWSNQHALCSLECAVLLAKWLEAVTVPSPSPPLNATEERVLNFVAQLVAETNFRRGPDKIMREKALLSSEVVRLWATLYKSESVWEMVDLIGLSLNAFADLLEDRHRNPQRS